MAGKRPPPAEFRFKPGMTGNGGGRPLGSKNKRPRLRTPALDEKIPYRIDGVLRRVSRREALVSYAKRRMLTQQDPKLTALMLEWHDKLAAAEAAVDYDNVLVVIPVGLSWRLENIEAAVGRLGLGRLIYPDHAAQRVALTPELVTLALSRFEGRQLSRDEQKLVVSFTLTPSKVKWPDWWEPDLRTRKCRVPERYFKKEKAEWKRALTCPPPPPPPPEPEFDLDAEWAKEPKWMCKRMGFVQTIPCDECASQKEITPGGCFRGPG